MPACHISQPVQPVSIRYEHQWVRYWHGLTGNAKRYSGGPKGRVFTASSKGPSEVLEGYMVWGISLRHCTTYTK